VILGFLGASIAWYDEQFNFGHALLAGFGLVLTHISVNTLNDYFDYKSGIDLATRRTPFSGGSGILPAGLLRPNQVFWLGLGSLLIAVPIGVYFIIVKGWLLLPLLLVAALLVIIYTPFILKTPYPEWAAGLGLGVLPVLGIYFAQTGVYTWPAVFASVPSGILVHNLLFLNEFPDVEADQKANRKTTPIIAGRATASVVYTVATIAVYVWIIAGVILRIMPAWASLALLTIPLAIKAIQGARRFDEPAKFMPAMASNVLLILLTQLLLGIGYILARVFG
jgi:1,4-dihydroxy-2-naphthoate octaprenyltransferase